MSSPLLQLTLIGTVAVALGSVTHRWHQDHPSARSQEVSVLESMMGDSRRLFANHFFIKADVYFHSGYYPSMFDQARLHESTGLEAHSQGPAPRETGYDEDQDEGHDHDEDHDPEGPQARDRVAVEGDYQGRSRDWIDRFGRHFYISSHTHLEQAGYREILPWLRMSASMDPGRVQTYALGAYVLRTQLDRVDEAETFLREGLRSNPNHHELLFELGRLYLQGRRQPDRARNLLELSLRRWRESEGGKEEPDWFTHQQIVSQLVRLEEAAGRWKEARDHLELLKQNSPSPGSVQERIDEIEREHLSGTNP
jgi:tetratricopeptide (TPR) repeat protein